jgi:hypothetical protein
MATHMPIMDRSQHFGYCEPMRSYCCAFEVPAGVEAPQGMYITIEKQHTRSIRPAYGNRIVIIAGEGHQQA